MPVGFEQPHSAPGRADRITDKKASTTVCKMQELKAKLGNMFAQVKMECAITSKATSISHGVQVVTD